MIRGDAFDCNLDLCSLHDRCHCICDCAPDHDSNCADCAALFASYGITPAHSLDDDAPLDFGSLTTE